MNRFVHIHSSSRFDRSHASLTAAAKQYNQDADVVTYTENAREDREKALRAGNGTEFGMVSGDINTSNDGVICYRRERFRVIHKEMVKSSDLSYFRKNGHATPTIYMTVAVLEDKQNGKCFAIGVIHLPAGVEGDLAHKSTTRRTLNWYSSFRNSKKALNKIAKEHGADARMFIADFNIDFKKLWARLLVKSLAPSYMNTWKNVNVAGGTHGKRIIDATLLRGHLAVKKPGAELYKDDASSDHRPYKETFSWL